jgi:CO/xanthine dehydrogenase Mo-binding subunit
VTINPNLAQGQVEGAIVQGLGMAAYEESHRTKNGRLIENDMMTYRIPTHKEAPHLTTEFADSHEESGPYGAKSVGEIGIDTPPAALSNAIYNATGVRITTLPITPEKILEGMKKKENDL